MARETGPGESDGSDTGGNLTPVMRQYQELKTKHPETILFFRIGDFYETFNSDAELVARELDIVLTSRSKSGDNRIPLAGVPYHAVEGYIAKLVGKGYKVAVCEQVGDPRTAKGIVKREISRIITPGTVIDSAMLPSPDAVYLMAICPEAKGQGWGIALLDITTGEFFVSIVGHDQNLSNLLSEIARYHPAECIIPSTIPEAVIRKFSERGVVASRFRDEAFFPGRARTLLTSHFHVATLAGFGCDDEPAAIGAAGAALLYAQEMQASSLAHISSLATRASSQSMMLDAVTLRNLEVKESIRGGTKGQTLFSVLNLTKTPMGSRLLSRHLTRPLLDTGRIDERLDTVEYFVTRTAVRLSVRSGLSEFADIERIAARVSYGNAGPRDLLALADSLAALPVLKLSVNPGQAGDLPAILSHALREMQDLPETIALIRRAIVEEPPAVARNGGVIREGFSEELDAIHTVLHSGRNWIVKLQEQERERTGIKSLKIGYNRIFGYYIDITRPNLALVPPDYERKQTTASGERYTIPELREKEALITNADEKVLALERELYNGLLESLRAIVPDVQTIAAGIAALDVAATLAEVACNRNYVRPLLNTGSAIVIRDGRHPVVESGVAGGFVPNDVDLSGSENQILVITGANMAGKSTYMRACALICIMAQAGGFVPARHASIGIIDRIFTRVGAFDDLASGQSTFFVEMLELSNILNNITPRSLVILDEIGRGTSTVDGCSIARAVLEYLHGKGTAGPKTLFATHFHELITAEETLKRVKNYHFAVKETRDEVIFLRKLIPGATDKSYGIHVARLAGIPKKVTDRADELLSEDMQRGVPGSTKPQRYTQILLVDDSDSGTRAENPALRALATLNPDEMTPLEALAKIAELKKSMEQGD
ncbi:MAG TPA: DNA mismatch repair protein MutS [Methanoregula sp.]|nr:DNA mismatch repair protein MutS [Methanoregula sp.]